MTKPLRHVLGISGGKDSAALAIYLRHKHPELQLEYYFCDTGKELPETYTLISNLENYLGQKITRLEAAEESPENSFDHFVKVYGGYLPSSSARWCTKKLKLEPFEKFVGNEPVVSYVGIRGDEDREGYISRKTNIQSIFPFRRNIWSEDVVQKVLQADGLVRLRELYEELSEPAQQARVVTLAETPLSRSFTQTQKLNALLDADTRLFNKVVFQMLRDTGYPLSQAEDFSLLNNDDNLIRADIFKLLRESGVGVPAYYEKITFEVDGLQGEYARSRSGCFFCFFQQKIEWVWLYEQHPDLFQRALAYERDGYTWMEESLSDLIKPARLRQIKLDAIKKQSKAKGPSSMFLLDILDDEEEVGCASCFI
ncbi:phosphoadenosine phosphosulfate reductase family protein [Hymenobacter sp. BT770]|uniref:phosphoadenosine phosphosulfate reductase family protein n=1 Tax=Hymenobacter sp. BT770 TaxID=2886942 RepID=UPI001D0F8A78|nr:phosphoadenosine phosphosulfate reductase family protein [Hymenobacter sp. BT770]MCC3154610.1 phosphoadenosine phosphosulfate reductase family protein [Hymenobacter sp. BT770]MDO3416664.1 phosphoadenosine phosphosulfate reductase family protein [Hymenobacter sp. BT770]